MCTIAVIPARKGSVRLPNKNRKRLDGIPLIDWTIRLSKKLKFIDDIILSTNDKKIIQHIKSDKLIKIFKRPEKLSKNNTKLILVVIDVIKKYEKKFGKVNTVLLLQPTSPYRSVKKINRAFKKYLYFKKKKSVLSVSKSNYSYKSFFQIKKKNLILSKKNGNKLFQTNGNFYIATPHFIRKNLSFYKKNYTYPIIINNDRESIDIDNLEDFNNAKRFLNL